MKKVFIALLGTAMMLAGGGCKQSEDTPADPVPAKLTGTVSITDATDDEGTVTLTADITQLGGSGTPAYKWLRDGTVISGEAGATYTLGEDDTAGSVITVEVSCAGYTGVKSASYTVTGEETPADPVLTGEVKITQEGTVLTAVYSLNGTEITAGVSYQWLRNGTVISEQKTYTLGDDDTAGSVITVEVSRAGYTGVVKSASYTVTGEETPADPVLTGEVKITQEGTVLTAVYSLNGTEITAGVSYQWLRNGTVISEQKTYTLGDDDTAGSVITVEVSRTGYTGVVKSASYTVTGEETV